MLIMKRIISIIVLCVILISCFTVTSFAADSTNEIICSETNDAERATGLITNSNIGLSKSGTTLTITGYTYCSTAVVKCGIRDIKVQRRANSDAEWETYEELDAYYVDSYRCDYEETITISNTNYQYRVTCVNYAKKNIFSVEKIENVSDIV